MSDFEVSCPLCRITVTAPSTLCPGCDQDLAILAYLRQRAILYYNEGLRLARSGDTKAAAFALQQVMAIDSGCADAMVVLGKIHAQNRSFASARDVWERAIRTEKEHPEATRCLAALDDREAAMKKRSARLRAPLALVSRSWNMFANRTSEADGKGLVTSPDADPDRLPRVLDPAAELATLAGRVHATGRDLRLDTTDIALTTNRYRIIHEAVTNALRHTAEGRITVIVSRSDSVVTIDVTNEGRFSEPVPGRGLGDMRARAEAERGTFEAGPTGDGFRVRAVLPA
ncbi:hypothetical protein Acor_55110 [Acrocarpospora corrugata]|uniref:histidine kinase n=1 Tax=Acrocarpospora corrugata TaxID=35763 RepID=A0A5M3W339_9ACTN|nr:tetratricopeptide repeat protein [Acrocarpospora corrugata]GES03445.1 hypothetical protein Acor_55110 [Acrocarpospora corrugata]